MRKIIIYIFSILAIASCKKIESNLENNLNSEPIYKMKGSINNQPFDFTMNGTTVLMSNGAEAINGMPSFFTEFSDIENTTSMKLSIIAPEKIYKNINQYPVSEQKLSFLVHQPGCYNLGFSTNPQNPPYIMCQDIGSDQFENKEAIELEGFGIYEIPVRFKGIDNETYSFTINHGFESNTWHAKFNVSADLAGISYESEFANSNHQWFLDGQAIGQSVNGSIPLDTSFNGLHTLSHLMTDNLGNKCSYSQILYVHSNDIKWAFETTQCTPSAIESNFEHIMITYNDNGENYSSAFSAENTNTTFLIKNIEYFIEDPTSTAISVKFDAAFNGILYNKDKSKKIELSDVVGTFKYSIE